MFRDARPHFTSFRTVVSPTVTVSSVARDTAAGAPSVPQVVRELLRAEAMPDTLGAAVVN